MKRILAIVLSLAMILVVFLMAGCGENDTPDTTKGSEPADTTASDKPGTSGGTSSGEETTGGSQSEDTSSGDDGSSSTVEIDGYNKLPGYEDVDFRGTTFVIVGDTATDEFSKSPSEEIYSEGTDTISVAVRLRNSTMEKLYNCSIQLIASDNPVRLQLPIPAAISTPLTCIRQNIRPQALEQAETTTISIRSTSILRTNGGTRTT